MSGLCAVPARAPRPPSTRPGDTYRLYSEPAVARPPQQPVVGVRLGKPRVIGAALLVHAREQDKPVHFLQAPPFLDKTRRQVIQQLGVAGRLGPRSQIVRRRYKPFPEMMQPEPINHHPWRQRIALADERPRKIQTPTAIRERRPRRTRQYFQKLPRNSRPFVAGITAHEHRLGAWF